MRGARRTWSVRRNAARARRVPIRRMGAADGPFSAACIEDHADVCGIAGFVGQGDRDLLERMVGTLVHRGPDDQGLWVEPGIGLGMRRLSIIDLPGGRQPMANEDEALRVVFNGEIYNFRALRSDLLERGHRFRTQSDTEVLLHLYEEAGAASVERLRGMFAFALWDASRKTLFLVRDRLGKKPLFYWHNNGLFLFASEIKALLCHPAVSRDVDWEAFHHYLAFGYTPGDRSIFAGIRKLPPGHIAIMRDGVLTLQRYWTLPSGESWTDERASVHEVAARVRHELREAVRLRLESDVPLGVFLSGGIDSSVVVACMREVTGQRIATFSIGFSRAAPSYDELPYARMVAQRFETDHTEEILEPKVADLLPTIVHHLDEPFADSSAIPTFVVAQATARHVKVVLSGIGGDETFAGYPRYLGLRLSERYARLPSWLRSIPDAVVPRLIPESEASRNWGDWARRFISGADRPMPDRYIGWTRFFDETDLRGLVTPDLWERWGTDVDASQRAAFAARTHGDPVDGAFRIDLSTYLPEDLLVMADRMSMAHSLELRAPFCDHRVIEESLRISPSMKIPGLRLKGLLKTAFADVLPPQVLSHRKQGFMIPLAQWLRTELRDMMEDLLSTERVRNRGLFVPERVEALKREHLGGIRTHSDRLWTLMMTELWMRHHVDGIGMAPRDTSEMSLPLRVGDVPEVPSPAIERAGERGVREEAPRPVRRGQQVPILGRVVANGLPETAQDPQRLLALSVAGLGDFVLGTPALRAVRQRFPRACIWILTIPEVRPLAERCPYVDAVRTLDLRRSRSAVAWALGRGRREVGQLIRELRGMRFDIAVNLYDVATRAGSLRMAAFLRAIGPGRTVGRSSRGRGIGFDLTSQEEVHELEAQLGVARLLGATPTSNLPELWVTDEDRSACTSLLEWHGVSKAEQVVCLSAGSAQPKKRWPEKRFAVVGRRLADAGVRVVLIGTDGERGLCNSLAQAIPRAISLAGATSLPVLAALLQRAALLVTNDSGPMHMAAALGVPLVATFGPEKPVRFAPRGRATCLVFTGTEGPGGPPWWEGIPVDAVCEGAVRLLGEGAARPQRQTPD